MINVTVIRANAPSSLTDVLRAANVLIKNDVGGRVFPAFDGVYMKATGRWQRKDGHVINFGQQDVWVRVHEYRRIWYVLDVSEIEYEIAGGPYAENLVLVKPFDDEALVAVYLTNKGFS
jgi:hypothetical protein